MKVYTIVTGGGSLQAAAALLFSHVFVQPVVLFFGCSSLFLNSELV